MTVTGKFAPQTLTSTALKHPSFSSGRCISFISMLIPASVRHVNHQNLGVLIAYLIPGFGLLWALSLHSSTIRVWLGASPPESPTLGGFLYVTVASLGVGVFLNIARGLLLDPIHHRTGIPKREWNYSQLQPNIAAVEFLLAYQFRYYQFSGNMLLTVIAGYALYELGSPGLSPWISLAAMLVAVVFWLSSRRFLATYYRRLGEVLGPQSGGVPSTDKSRPSRGILVVVDRLSGFG